MVDSIVFNLNIKNFPVETRNNIIRHWKKKESYKVENAKGLKIEKSSAFLHHNVEHVFTRKHLHFHMPYSNHYTLACDLDDIQNTIQFNFSVPKFYYGINLIPNFYHYSFKDNLIYDQTFCEENLKASFDICLNAIFESVNLLISEKIPLNYLLENIHIFRIDICKNYLFDSEADCVSYLDNLKKIKIPYASLHKPRIYENEIMYVFQDYSIKVYHKGKEMEKDLKKIGETYSKHEIEQIMQIANRTLRYELTFRTQKIRDLFLTTFRENCPMFIQADEIIRQKFARGIIRINNRNSYYEESPESEMKWWYKDRKPNKKFFPDQNFNCIFDFKTFIELVRFAFEKFDWFQAIKRPSMIEINRLIDEGNVRLELYGQKKIKKAPLLKICKMLEDRTLSELVKDKEICNASKFNYLKKFRMLSIPIGEKSCYNHFIENTDISGECFMNEINIFADKCLQMTIDSKNEYLKGIR